jgi:diguanylate cyclase (GGDEF)-like protein
MTLLDQPDKQLTSLDVVLRCFVSALDADSGIIVGQNPEDKIELLSAAGYAARRATVPWTQGSFLGQALRSSDASLEPASGWKEGGGTPDAWHAVASRIKGPDGSLGAIYAGFERPSPLTRGQLTWAADSHARLAALCMTERGDAVSEVLRSTGVDQLTGCLRYERVMEMLRGEVQRSTRQGHNLSCCFLDIDGFQTINKEHGHGMGNKVLASVGRALLGSARGFDCVGRLGGDEFVVVMPETTLAQAGQAAARMRFSAEAGVFTATGLEISASAGVAQWKRGDSMLQLLEVSDRALQTDKAANGTPGDVTSAPVISDGILGLVRAARSRVAPHGGRKSPER